jgi:hypothetical protein
MHPEKCSKHPEAELVEVVIRLCPKCRGSAGGTQAAANMTAKARATAKLGKFLEGRFSQSF